MIYVNRPLHFSPYCIRLLIDPLSAPLGFCRIDRSLAVFAIRLLVRYRLPHCPSECRQKLRNPYLAMPRRGTRTRCLVADSGSVILFGKYGASRRCRPKDYSAKHSFLMAQCHIEREPLDASEENLYESRIRSVVRKPSARCG